MTSKQYKQLVIDIKLAGYQGLEGAGTASKQWIKLIHPEKSVIFEGVSEDDCLNKIQQFIKRRG